MSTQTITQLFAQARLRPAQSEALRFRRDEHWQAVNWNECYRTSELLGAHLLSLGVQAGDRIAILSNTRPEWFYADFAIMGIGAVTVPIYHSQRPEECEFILRDCEAKIAFVEDSNQLKKWQEIAPRCPSVKAVIALSQLKDSAPGCVEWDEALSQGQKWLDTRPDFFLQGIARHTLTDVATILYTSGTTGEPKGVVLTHQQIVSEIQDVLSVIPLGPTDVSLTFLPFAHILGRVEAFAAVAAGFCMAFAESVDRLRFNLAEVKPTFFIGVPRVFEKIYTAILTQSEANPVTQKIFTWAIETGRKVSAHRRRQEALPFDLLAAYKLAQKLVLAPIKKKLGGRLRFVASGGAPLSREIAEFFHAADILILEGYGLTETTAAITFNTPLAYRFGTVGRALGDSELKIASDGEILVRSQKVMREYFNNPSATSEAIVDGYFATGDIGEIDADGFLHITDRKKDLIKTAGGKYVAPQKLENLLKVNSFISNVLIHGDNEKFIVAVVTLNPLACQNYAQSNDISYQDFAMLTQHPQIKGLIRGVIAGINGKLASFETIKNFAILAKDFTVEEGELTPSLKVKRKFCSQKYRDMISALYS